jgi:hypothetical protein
MIDYAIYNQQGEFVSKGQAEAFDESALQEGYHIYYGLVFPDKEYIDVDTEAVRQKGPQPTENHKFDYTTKTWILDPVYAANQALNQRQQLLQQSDWTDTVSAQQRLGSMYAQWQTYRQLLRDITLQAGYPYTITWPTQPE